MEIITIFKLKIESNHTLQGHRYYWCTHLYTCIISLVRTLEASSSIYMYV